MPLSIIHILIHNIYSMTLAQEQYMHVDVTNGVYLWREIEIYNQQHCCNVSDLSENWLFKIRLPLLQQ